MTKYEVWPPPANWTEIIIVWNEMLNNDSKKPQEILEWVDTHPGKRYHLHGYKGTVGFAFRFEDPNDAILFSLRWV